MRFLFILCVITHFCELFVFVSGTPLLWDEKKSERDSGFNQQAF